jgi:hypothetical protein
MRQTTSTSRFGLLSHIGTALTASALFVTALFLPQYARAQSCPFDNGASSLANEGLVLTRYALGLRGAPMVANTSFAVGDATTIESNIVCPACGLSVTGDSTFSVADAAIISRKIAGFSGAALTNGLALGSGTRNTPQAVQSFLLSGCGTTLPTCGVGELVRVGSNGSLQCSILPNTVVTLDPRTSTGRYNSIAMPSDGLPIVAYRDDSSVSLKLAKCDSATCSGLVATSELESGGFTPAIAIAGDGLPIIAHVNNSNSLRVIKCSEPTCSAGNAATSVAPSGTFDGTAPVAIAVPSDGRAIITHLDPAGFALRVTKCGNIACSAANITTTIDGGSGAIRGSYASVAVPSDGLPVIAYSDDQNSDLKIAKCTNSDCSTGATLTTVDNVGNVGKGASVAIGLDGLPVVSYVDSSNARLRVLKCGNASCSAGNSINLVESDPQFPVAATSTTIAVPADGLPIIGYVAFANSFTLRTAKCSSGACSGSSVRSWVDATTAVETAPGRIAVAVGADGLPVFSYYNHVNQRLKAIKCSNSACRNP